MPDYFLAGHSNLLESPLVATAPRQETVRHNSLNWQIVVFTVLFLNIFKV